MKDRDKILMGLGFGLIAGGAAGYYLASDEGKKMRKKAKKQMKKINKEVQETFKEQSEVINEKLNTISDSTKSWVNEMSDTVMSRIKKSYRLR